MKIKASITFACICLSATLTTAAMAGTPGIAYVDFSSTAQTMRGFGGSTAWMPKLTSAQADTLFGNDNSQQIGLSILRLRIDPGGPAKWGNELGNAQQAQARGASIIATPWTPPVSMKSNNSTVGGVLNTGSYAAYADYLESFVTYMADAGVSLYAISMQNEPDARVTYESCGWSGASMATWVANHSSVLSTRLIAPESESFHASYADPMLNDPTAAARVSIIAGHVYGTPPLRYPNAGNKEVWMTEHYLKETGIAGALALAKEMHDAMTVANYNAYLWWWVADWPALHYTNGLIDTNGKVTLNGYAMAHYAKFVRPGYVRANATDHPSADVYVSAYKGNGHAVIVALNLGASAIDQPFALQNQSVTILTPYQTSSTESMVQLRTVNVSNDAFTATLPAQSITTFVH